MVTPDIHELKIYVCGPPGFMETAKKILTELILGQPFRLSNLHFVSIEASRPKGRGFYRSAVLRVRI